MGFRFKKILSICLSIVMLLSVESCIFAAAADNNTSGKKITDYSVGDILEFGWYPQSKVEDSSVIAELNSLAGDNSTWTSYGYYSGTGSRADGQMTAGDWMRYTDVIYGSNKYRGVIFDSYRPYYTGYTSSSTYQDDNGYYTGTVYWFLYEPIEWRVLDPKTGMVMSETILDSQAYNNYILSSYGCYWGDSSKTYYANNYEKSSIRQWLNNDFYNTAFSYAQQNIIEFTALDNSEYSTYYSQYDSDATNDKIYLLSYSDTLNENYGFSTRYSEYDTARRAKGSDYAKSQGLYVYTGNEDSSYYGNSNWRLRSAGYHSGSTCGVSHDGCVYSDYFYITDYTYYGVRPALNFNPESDIFQSDVKDTGKSTANGTGSKVTDGDVTDGDVTDGDVSKTVSLGDVDCDGFITAFDVRLTLRASVGLVDCENWYNIADVDGDGEICAADARWILRASVGLETLSGSVDVDETDFKLSNTNNFTKDANLEIVFDGTDVKLYAKNCQFLASGNLVFNFNSDVVTKVRIVNGGDAKAVLADNFENNSFTSENNTANVNEVRYGFYFKDYLWSSEKFAEEDLSEEANINGEYFHLATFRLTLADGKTAKDINASFSGSLFFTDNDIIEKSDISATFTNDTTVIEPHVHAGGTATCSTKAVCTACGTSYGELDKSNHENVVTVKAVAATCTKAGLTEGKKCTVCGEVTVKQQTVAAKGHKEEVLKAVAATCTKAGLTEGKKCTVCGEVTVKQQTVAALGHDKINHAAKAATCTEKGYEAYVTCSRCDYTTYKELAALGHNYSSEWTIDKAPTSTAAGSKSHHCTYCDSITDVTAIPATTNDTPNSTQNDNKNDKMDKKPNETPSIPNETPSTPNETPNTPSTSDYILGDIDGDGNATAADARLALRASVGLEDYKEGTKEFLAADVDNDNKVTAADARLILRASVELETLGI